MPYELSFSKRVEIESPTQYFNDCCIGGDVVSAALLPSLRARYGTIDAGQEDWGWFMWFSSNGLRLAADVFNDEHLVGRFRVRLTSSKRGLLFGWKSVDTVELDELKELVRTQLVSWAGSPPLVTRED